MDSVVHRKDSVVRESDSTTYRKDSIIQGNNLSLIEMIQSIPAFIHRSVHRQTVQCTIYPNAPQLLFPNFVILK